MNISDVVNDIKLSQGLQNIALPFDKPVENVIAEILRRSVVKGTKREVSDGAKTTYETKEFSHKEKALEWIEAIYYFNYKKLIQIKENNAKILSENRPELFLQQAYICAFLRDYISAYYCLENAAISFYREREYSWYFISLWNKKNVAKIIIEDVFYNCGISQDVRESIMIDYDAIDLDKTLQTIPNLGNDNNQFLRDLKDFKFASDLFYDVVSSSMKSKEQASEAYFMFVGVPAYEQLRQQVYDYSKYKDYL